MISLGERIKEARKIKKLTQNDLAAQLNVSRSAVSNWEVGRNYPDLELIVQLSDILEISLDNLLREDTVMVAEISEEQRKGVHRKRLLGIIVPLFFLSLFITGYLLYQEVSSVKNIFSPNIDTMVILEEEDTVWTPVTFEEEPYLNMEGFFWNEEVVNDVGSQSNIEMRISNANSGETIYELNLKAGEKYSLEDLEKDTEYFVEVRGDKGRYFLYFY